MSSIHTDASASCKVVTSSPAFQGHLRVSRELTSLRVRSSTPLPDCHLQTYNPLSLSLCCTTHPLVPDDGSNEMMQMAITHQFSLSPSPWRCHSAVNVTKSLNLPSPLPLPLWVAGQFFVGVRFWFDFGGKKKVKAEFKFYTSMKQCFRPPLPISSLPGTHRQSGLAIGCSVLVPWHSPPPAPLSWSQCAVCIV